MPGRIVRRTFITRSRPAPSRDRARSVGSLSVSALLVLAAVATSGCAPLSRSPRSGTASADDAPLAPAAPAPTDVAAVDGRPVEPDSAAGASTARVVRAVDGDTIVVQIGGVEERVRLIGIDTPESVKPDHPVECYGHEASEHMSALLPADTPVRLLGDAEPRDTYGRLLAYVFRISDDLFVNLAMAAEGFANTLSIAPNVTFADDFRAAVGSARSARLGLWRACPDPDGLFGRDR